MWSLLQKENIQEFLINEFECYVLIWGSYLLQMLVVLWWKEHCSGVLIVWLEWQVLNINIINVGFTHKC